MLAGKFERVLRLLGSALENIMDCSEPRIPLKDLAKIAEVDVRTMRKYVYEGVEPGFCKLFKVSREVYKMDNRELLNWCDSLVLPENIKAAMEFMLVNNKLEELKEFIECKAITSINKSLRRWGKLYLLIISYEEGIITGKEILKQTQTITPSDKEIAALICLVQANACYRTVYEDAAYLSQMSTLCDQAIEQVLDLKDCFLKMSFEARLNDLLCKRELYVRTNAEKSREYANKNISQDICAFFKANSYYLVGISFMFESYEESISNTESAISEYRGAGYSRLADDLERYSLPLINAHYGVKDEGCKNVELAHYEAKWGDKELAKKLIDEAIEKGGESMYKIYYKGMAHEDDDMVFDSLLQFLSMGDRFFAQFPLEHLRKSKDPKIVLLAEMTYKRLTN